MKCIPPGMIRMATAHLLFDETFNVVLKPGKQVFRADPGFTHTEPKSF